MTGKHETLATAYMIAGTLLLPPSTTLGELATGKLLIAAREAGEAASQELIECPRLTESLKHVASELEKLEDNERLEEYRTEYTRVLLSSPRGPLCPPYESSLIVRMKPRQIALRPIVDRLRRYYGLLGVEVAADPPVTEDHASVELEYLAALHEALKDAEGDVRLEINDLRKRFLREHVSKWLPRLAGCLKRNTEDKLLQALASLLESLLECEERL